MYTNSTPFFFTQTILITSIYFKFYYKFQVRQSVVTLIYCNRIQFEFNLKKSLHTSFKVAGSISNVILE